MLILAAGQTASHAKEPPPQAELDRWIRELDAEVYATRAKASRQLSVAGISAVSRLEVSAQTRSLEVGQRTIQILKRMTATEQHDLAQAARDALLTLAESPRPEIARRATEALRFQQTLVLVQLQALNARVQMEGDAIVGLSFDGTGVQDEHMKLVAQLSELRSLSLGGTAIGDQGLEHLRGMPLLESLNLYRSQIGDDGLQHLLTLPKLRHLPMGETHVTDAGMVHLSQLKQLDYLGLRANAITDAGVKKLKGLTNLTGLYLGETEVTDAGLPALGGMLKMQHLRLHNTTVTDAGLVHLKMMTDLHMLDLWDTLVSAAGKKALNEALPDAQIRLNESE